MPDRYAVIGNPIAQSKSPIIHALFARTFGHSISYERIEAPIGGFIDAVAAFRASGARGVNVTAPFKTDAFDYATHPSERARVAGAVNCMKFIGSDTYAENFDGVGPVRDITVNLRTPLAGLRVLILGAGGATRGALAPIMAENPQEIIIANRDVQKAQLLVDGFAERAAVVLRASSYEALSASNTNGFDVVLNATSASLTATLPPITATVFFKDTLAYDLSYGKGLTPYLRFAMESGARRIEDGVGMLVEQAAEAYRWWRGVRPDTREAIDAIRVPLI